MLMSPPGVPPLRPDIRSAARKKLVGLFHPGIGFGNDGCGTGDRFGADRVALEGSDELLDHAIAVRIYQADDVRDPNLGYRFSNRPSAIRDGSLNSAGC